jgi:hypothetical protein
VTGEETIPGALQGFRQRETLQKRAAAISIDGRSRNIHYHKPRRDVGVHGIGRDCNYITAINPGRVNSLHIQKIYNRLHDLSAFGCVEYRLKRKSERYHTIVFFEGYTGAEAIFSIAEDLQTSV